jgi:hypothetical protein
MRREGDTFEGEVIIAHNLSDAYIDDVLVPSLGGEGFFVEVMKEFKGMGPTEYIYYLEDSSDSIAAMWNPEYALNAEWLIDTRFFTSMSEHLSLGNLITEIPGISDIVFKPDEKVIPAPPGGFDNILAYIKRTAGIGDYIDQLMPYIDEMVVAALNEMETPVEGNEDVKLGGSILTLDTLDVKISDLITLKMIIAAFAVLEKNPAAQDLLIKIYNETFAEGESENSDVLDSDIMKLGIDQYLNRLKSDEEFFINNKNNDENRIYIRFYLRDGIIVGLAALRSGIIIVKGSGYTLWYNDLPYGDYEAVRSVPPAYKAPDIVDRIELHGELRDGVYGQSGEIWLLIKENDETFDEMLVSFSDINIKEVFGLPALTGKFILKANDLYNAFFGKETIGIEDVRHLTKIIIEDWLDALPSSKDTSFSLEFIAADDTYTTIIKIEDESRESSASLSLKAYYSE